MADYSKTTWVAGVTEVNAARMNQLETQYDTAKQESEAGNWIRPNPTARVTRTVDVGIGNGTPTYLPFDAETFDTGSFHDNVTNNSRLTIPSTGYYLIMAHVVWESSAAGARSLKIEKNGGSILAYSSEASPPTVEFYQQVSTIAYLTVGEYVELEVTQNSGGTLDILQLNYYSPIFCIAKVSD